MIIAKHPDYFDEISDGKPSKNIAIKWLKKPHKDFTKKDAYLKDYVVAFQQAGTLLAPRLDADVYINYIFREQSYKQMLSGPASELYSFMIINARKREAFSVTWSQARGAFHRKNKTLFPQAASGEKLSKKLTEDGMTPRKFAEKTKKDYTQVFRELKGTRPLSLKQGIEYSKELDCDPVDLLFDDLSCSIWGTVDLYNVRDLGNEKYFPCEINPAINKSTIVPRNIYKPNIMAINVNSPGSWLHAQTAFYYKTNSDSADHNGKMVVAKTTDEGLEDFGIETTRYWFGVYNILKGGKQEIVNPDRNAEKQFICSGPFEFVAPVVSLVHPTALERGYDYYELNRRSHEIHQLQEMTLKIEQEQKRFQKLMSEQMSKLYYEKNLKRLNNKKTNDEVKEHFDKSILQQQLDRNNYSKEMEKVLKELEKLTKRKEDLDFEIPDFVKKIA